MCERGAMLRPAHQLQASLDAIALLRDLFCDGPVIVPGIMSGAMHAVDAARRRPARIGACYGPRTDGPAAGALRRGLFSLARNSPGVMMVGLRLLADRVSRPVTYRRLINQHYQGSPGDLAVI